LLRHLGAEPLEKGFNGAFLAEKLKGRKQPVKTAIMDQRLVVGVGNIYACEALFAAGVHPLKPAGKLSRAQLDKLAGSIKEVLRAAIASGGSTLRDYVRSDGELGYFQHHFRVYGREGKPCPVCKTPIKRIVQGGRSTFFCPKDQKR
jgi:formamidopyrimidine-DNA glycosylase